MEEAFALARSPRWAVIDSPGFSTWSRSPIRTVRLRREFLFERTVVVETVTTLRLDLDADELVSAVGVFRRLEEGRRVVAFLVPDGALHGLRPLRGPAAEENRGAIPEPCIACS
jgi:hypothetical protein